MPRPQMVREGLGFAGSPRTAAGWLTWADANLSKVKREHYGARPWSAFQYDGQRAVSAPTLLEAIQRAYRELSHRP